MNKFVLNYNQISPFGGLKGAYPSDGFLPQYTQELQNIPASNRYKIEGANHIEVRNMSNSTLNGQPNDATKLRFDEIFNRGDFFHTPTID